MDIHVVGILAGYGFWWQTVRWKQGYQLLSFSNNKNIKTEKEENKTGEKEIK